MEVLTLNPKPSDETLTDLAQQWLASDDDHPLRQAVRPDTSLVALGQALVDEGIASPGLASKHI